MAPDVIDIAIAKQALFGKENDEAAQELRRLEDTIRLAIFRGIDPRDERYDEVVDRRLPFSESLGRACFTQEKEQSRLAAGAMQSSEIIPGTMTPFGAALQEAAAGNTFVDLGCGGDLSHLPKKTAHLFAARYVGVDKCEGFTERVERDNANSVYLRGDILETLAKLGRGPKKGSDLVLFLCGIELSRGRALYPGDPTDSRNDQYAEECRKEMERIRPRAVVIGPGTSPDFRPDPRSFVLTAAHEVCCGVGELQSASYELWVPKNIPEMEHTPVAQDAGGVSPIEWA